MKNLTVCLMLVIGFCLTTKVQAQSADIKFETETHTFGKVSLGKPVTFDFKYTNLGDAPLIISKAEGSSNDIVLKFSKESLSQNGTAVVSVTYTPTGNAAPFSKTITIASNARIPVKVLYIKGEIIP